MHQHQIELEGANNDVYSFFRFLVVLPVMVNKDEYILLLV